MVLQTANELVTLPRSEVKSLKASKLSMMPEGLIDNLPEADIRDLQPVQPSINHSSLQGHRKCADLAYRDRCLFPNPWRDLFQQFFFFSGDSA